MDSSQLSIRELQQTIETMFGHKDSSRGIEGTFMWFTEEIGELAADLRQYAALKASQSTEVELDAQRHRLSLEFADVLAWLVTLANMSDVDLQSAIREKYIKGCPKCHQEICHCQLSAKP